jgi:hypothetical protein
LPRLRPRPSLSRSGRLRNRRPSSSRILTTESCATSDQHAGRGRSAGRRCFGRRDGSSPLASLESYFQTRWA